MKLDIPISSILDPPEVQFRTAMLMNDIQPPPSIELDGNIHRYGAPDNLWYIGWGDGVPAGKAGNWKTGQEISWVGDIGRALSAAEQMANVARMAEAKKRHEEEKLKKNATAREQVQKIWDDAMPASPDHPYLKRKGVGVYNVKSGADGRLIVPLYDREGNLSTCQYIAADGDKKYHPGGATKGCFHLIGEIADKVYIAEGYATGATIHEVTKDPVVIAYSAGNLVDVTGIVRERYPSLRIIIVADNDKSGTGKNYADQASAKHGAEVVMPPLEGDANDYVKAGGDLMGLLDAPNDEWLVSADDWSDQNIHIQWLIKKWLQKDSTMMVFGPSGAGKSFVVLDWCLRLSSGIESWHGFKVNPVPVVYLVGEGHNGIKARIKAWKQHHGANAGKLWVSRSGTDLNLPGPLQKAMSYIRSLPENPGLIVVDTVHRFLAGDENSAQDVKTMLDACSLIQKEFSCSVLLVHHTGVSEEAQRRARGSSSWRGAMDIEINVRPEGDNIIVQHTKVKDGEEMPPMTMMLQSVPIHGWFDEDGEQVTSAVVVQGIETVKVNEKDAEKVKDIKDAWYDSGMEWVDGKPYISRSAAREFLKNHRKKVGNIATKMLDSTDKSRWIGKLVHDGIIIDDGDGFFIVDNGIISVLNMSL